MSLMQANSAEEHGFENHARRVEMAARWRASKVRRGVESSDCPAILFAQPKA
jgi:hypothetical protein